MRFTTILHPTDFSAISDAAFQYAVALAHDHGARLIVLHAVETLGPENVTYGEAANQPQPGEYRQRLWDDLHRVRSADPQIAVEYVLSEEDPVAAILRTAVERNCDLIVLGGHGRTGWRRLLGGSVAEAVVRRAECPVLVIKQPGTPAQLAAAAHTALHPQSLSEPGS